MTQPLSAEFLNNLSAEDRRYFLDQLAAQASKKTLSPLDELREQALKGAITADVYQERYLEIVNEIRDKAPQPQTVSKPDYAPWDSREHRDKEFALAGELGLVFTPQHTAERIFEILTPYRDALRFIEDAGKRGIPLNLDDPEIDDVILSMIAPYDSLNALAEDYALMECIGLPVLNPAVTREHLKRLVAPFRAAHEQQRWPVEW